MKISITTSGGGRGWYPSVKYMGYGPICSWGVVIRPTGEAVVGRLEIERGIVMSPKEQIWLRRVL